jgi:lipoprotein-releasing system permease protein
VIESRIARRYLWAARKKRHTAFLSAISILGLALGVAALLFSIALLSGLQGQIKSRLIAESPQLLVEPVGRNTIERADEIVAAARSMGMRDVRPYISGIAWAGNEERGLGRPVRVRSYAPGRAPQADPHARRSVFGGATDDPQIYMTRTAVAGVGLDLGDTITIVAPRSRLTPFGPVPVWKKYRITRIVPPTSEADSIDAWLAESDAANFFATAGKPTAIEMFGDANRSDAIRTEMQSKFGDAAQFKTWKEINRALVLALRLEKVVMFATISLVIFVAALNLVSSLSMLILEKRPSVGVLRTIGATERTVLSVFMQVGLLIGLTGTVLGNVFGLGIAWLANRYHLIPLPSHVYFISYLPFSIDVEDVVIVNVIAVFLSVVATWYPARIASRLDPITAIQEG